MHFAQWSSILLCKLHSYSSTTVQTTQYIAQWSSILLCKLHSYSSTTVQTTQYNITYCVVCTVDHETTQYTVYCAVHCAKCTVNCAVCTVNLWVFLKNLAFFNVFNKKINIFESKNVFLIMNIAHTEATCMRTSWDYTIARTHCTWSGDTRTMNSQELQACFWARDDKPKKIHSFHSQLCKGSFVVTLVNCNEQKLSTQHLL